MATSSENRQPRFDSSLPEWCVASGRARRPTSLHGLGTRPKALPHRTQASVTLRKADARDIDAVLELLNEQFGQLPCGLLSERPGARNVPELSRMQLNKNKGWNIVAEHRGRLVGHLGWRIGIANPQEVAVRYVELQTLYVRPPFRACGLGQQLFSAFAAERARLAISLTRYSQQWDQGA